MRRALLATALTFVICAAASAGDYDFQPHPSHAPPPPPRDMPMPSPPKFSRPKRISGPMPQFPEEAQHYTVRGDVIARFKVRADGSLESVSIVSGPPLLADSVLRAASKWRFEKRPEGSEFSELFAFTPDRFKDPRLNKALRPMRSAPTDAKQFETPLTYGFAYYRVMIDARGAVVDRLEIACEPEQFRASAEAIIAKLEFEPAAQASENAPRTINQVLVDYANDGIIRVQQRPGG